MHAGALIPAGPGEEPCAGAALTAGKSGKILEMGKMTGRVSKIYTKFFE
jgi:hypothetical protein